jgi:hypothetical protein
MRENRRAYLHLHTHESDEVAMARFYREDLELMQAEIDFYTTRDATKKKGVEWEASPPPSSSRWTLTWTLTSGISSE